MANLNLGNLGAVLKNSGMSEDQKKRIAMMNGVDLGQGAGVGGAAPAAAGSDWMAGLGTAVTTPYSSMSENLFSTDYRGNPLTAATAEQAGTLRQIKDAYSKGDMDTYNRLKNGLQTSGQFVSVAGTNGSTPTGYMVVNGGPAGGHMAMVLDGKVTGGLPLGSVLQDGYGGAWRVTDDQGNLEAVQRTPSAGAASAGAVKSVDVAKPKALAGQPNQSASPTMGKLGSTSGGTTPQQDYLADYEESMFGSVTSPWTETPPTVDPFQYGDAPTYGGSQYDARRDQLLDQLEGSKFSYDPANDPVWQSYQKQYRREGQRATEDALGRAAAATGGVASSYAATAAAQAGNYYASQLADKIPQLYNDAYSRYLAQYEQQLGLADRYNQFGQQDYQKFRDELSQFNTDRNFAYGAYNDQANRELEDYLTRYQQYLDEQNRLERERSWAYGVDQDAKKWAWDEDERAYQRAWDEDQRAYGRAWDENEREYGRAWDEDERTYKREQDAEERARQDRLDQISMAEMGAKYGDYSGLQEFGIDTSNLGGIVYAYAADGSTYNIGTEKGRYFIANAAPGQSMQGGDGSMWTKNADGGVTITKNGKTYTISAQQMMVEAATSGSGGSSGSSGGGGNRYSNLDYAGMRAAGLTNEAQIYNWFKSNGFSDASTQTKYYLAWLKEQEEADQDLAQNIQNDYSTAQVMRMIHGDGQQAVAMPSASGAAPSTSAASTAATSKGGGKTDIVNLSEGYRSWWPKIRDAFTGGASTQEVAGMIYNLALQGVLNDNDINAMLDQLGI